MSTHNSNVLAVPRFGKVRTNLVIHTDDTIVDHTWILRADHGVDGVGWAVNESGNGAIVNGNRVTIYGLFVEHHLQYQVLWNGEAGRIYFLPVRDTVRSAHANRLHGQEQRGRLGKLQDRGHRTAA